MSEATNRRERNDDWDHPKLPRGRTGRPNRKAESVFEGSRRTFAPWRSACRIEYAGPMPETGPMMVEYGGRSRERQRACVELKHGRTKPTDGIVATCGNPRCLDHRHLRIVPAAKPPHGSHKAA